MDIQAEPRIPLAEHSLKTVLILVVGCVFFGFIIGQLLVLTLSWIQGVDFADLINSVGPDADLATRNFLRTITLINHVCIFLIPAILVTWFLHRRDGMQFLQLNQSPKWVLLGLATFLIFAAAPLVQLSLWLNQLVPLPEWASGMEDQTEGLLGAFLKMESIGEFIFSFILMGITPAIGEELLFRGIIQQKFEKHFKNGHLAIWLTAFIFSFFHFQFAGFLPRMLLGGILGYLFYWSRNLWVPIFAHLLFNGMQVIGTWLFQEKIAELNLETTERPAFGVLLISIILVPAISIAIKRITKSASKEDI